MNLVKLKIRDPRAIALRPEKVKNNWNLQNLAVVRIPSDVWIPLEDIKVTILDKDGKRRDYYKENSDVLIDKTIPQPRLAQGRRREGRSTMTSSS